MIQLWCNYADFTEANFTGKTSNDPRKGWNNGTIKLYKALLKKSWNVSD